MRAPTLFLAPALAAVLAATPTGALERVEGRMTDDDRDAWTASASCRLAYYNNCNGWLWVWSERWGGWPPDARVGVRFDSCCDDAVLASTWLDMQTVRPPGYGYTASLSVFACDSASCPVGTALASGPVLEGPGWNLTVWNTPVPPSFLVVVTMATPEGHSGNYTAFLTDNPHRSGGLCFPLSRPVHSFYFGAPSTPYCPGQTFNDGYGDAELLWEADVLCPTHVQDTTWGGVKSLYR